MATTNTIGGYTKDKQKNNKKMNSTKTIGGILKMNTGKILAFSLIIMGLIGISGIASALTVSDGGDNVVFAGENVTLSDLPAGYDYNYLWVIDSVTKQAYIGSNASDNLTNGLALTTSTYTFSTNNQSAAGGNALIHIYIRPSNSGTSPIVNATANERNGSFRINNFTITVLPNANVSFNQGVLSGDNATVYINTTGNDSATVRAGATFTVQTTEGATPVLATTDTTNGNVVYTIPVTSTAYNGHNVTVWNGIVNRTGNYSVRKLVVVAADRIASTQAANSVVLKSVDANGALAAFNTSNFGNLIFNLTISGRTNDNWGNISTNLTIYNVTFNAGQTNKNVSNILNVSSDTTTVGTITANCANFTLTASDTYTIRTANLTVDAAYANITSKTIFNATETIVFSGWTHNFTENITYNISFWNGTGYTLVNTTVNVTPAIDGTWNGTWPSIDAFNTSNAVFLASTQKLAGTYVIYAFKDNNKSYNTSFNVTIADVLTIDVANSTWNAYTFNDTVYVDWPITITGSSSRLNNTNIMLNVSCTGTSNTTFTNTAVFGAAAGGYNGTYTTSWTGVNLTTGTCTLRVSTGQTNVTKTITLANNLTAVVPAVGPRGSSITINGTSTRATGTPINISVKDSTGLSLMATQYSTTTVSSGNWSFVWNTTTNGTATAAALAAGTYTLIFSDNITNSTYSIVLGDASITLSAPTTEFYDRAVNITGSTTYPMGTVISINVTNCSNGGNITTITATVNSTQQFLAQLTPSTYAAEIKANTTIYSTGTGNLCFIGNASGTTASNTVTTQLVDNLAVTTQDQVVAGDQVLLTATTSRANATTITFYVALGNYNVSTATTVEKQNMAYTSGSVTGLTYYATTDGASGSPDIGAGTYTVYATDGVTIATKTMTVLASGTIAITTPTTSQQISIGDNFLVSGTTNRANNTNVSIQVAGINSTTVYTNSTSSGTWQRYWNTTGYTAGTYTVIASHVGKADTIATVVVELTTASTTTTTTTTGSTTTTTNAGGCVMPGNGAPCDEVDLSEAIAGITSWRTGDLTLTQVIDLISAWAGTKTAQ